MIEVIALVLLCQQPLQPVAEGIASYYTVASSGSVTASGELLQDHKFTCALPKGDFGAHYLVVAENGRSVIVRHTDSGPYVSARVIDLSLAAMRQLDPKNGLLKVKIYRMGHVPSSGT
ncbi:MAG TPA: septal ring lytic transglycosylase RlpA family protein [Candidatus Hydrogenedentes bacterium]|nr:septal ring lytic transglycosylase RlpA family protein [Candidatus Hydrogenedentota bacterium]HOS04193.1 septal ring lytic transglycosylase RlpA family protein [Candidatus Hydrogenedentota bacterium]